MELRNNKQVTDIIDHIKDVWQLSLNEEHLLDSLLILFSAQKTEKLKQIEYLLNEEDSELLETLHQRDIEDYACRQFDMISKNDRYDLVGALKDLNYDFLEEVTDTEMIEALEEDGWHVSLDNGYTNSNIVEESQFEEWKELFSNLSVQERENILKGWYNG
jgi:hypothetical protein